MTRRWPTKLPVQKPPRQSGFRPRHPRPPSVRLRREIGPTPTRRKSTPPIRWRPPWQPISAGVFEKDFGLHLNIIAQSTNVIFYNATTDPYSAGAVGAKGAWNAELQNTLSSRLTGVGTTLAANNAAYDIGHLFGASGGGGNAGCIGCVCDDDTAILTDTMKGSGFTSPGTGLPQGDKFDIDYVAHEMGHQLGGNHTFSDGSEGTGVNVEIGSGISIMGYAGITLYDLAPNSIDKFHAKSIEQIQANLITKSCPVVTNIAANNATPVANAGLDGTTTVCSNSTTANTSAPKPI